MRMTLTYPTGANQIAVKVLWGVNLEDNVV